MKTIGCCSLRRATNADVPAVWALIAEVLQSYGIHADGKTTDGDLLDLESSFADDKGRFWVLLSGSTVIGTVALRICPRGRVEICRMYLSLNYRRRGLGRAMLQHVMSEAAELKPRTLFLKTASVLTEAIALYRSVGFEVVNCGKAEGNCDTLMERPVHGGAGAGSCGGATQVQTGTSSTISRL